MARNVVKAKLDIIFKKLFTQDDNMLKNFLCDILDFPSGTIKEIQVLNGEILPEEINGKNIRLDIKAQADDRIIDVEIQMQDKGNFKDRSLYYWAKMYTEQLDKGEDYREANQTISINILNYDLFKDTKEAYSTFKFLETKRNELLTDKCIVLYFELKKVNNKIDKNDRKKLWLQLINAETEEELNMIKEAGVPEVNKAVDFIYKMSEDEKTKEMAKAREAYLKDERNAYAHYREMGRDDMIAAMRKAGASESFIKSTLDNL